MKENDLKIAVNQHPLAMFAEKEDGTYGMVETGSYMVQNYFDDFSKKQMHFKNSALEKLRTGGFSPIGYYIEILNMTEDDVAARISCGVSKVKKHCTVKGFKSATISDLEKYAYVFDIDLHSLFRLDPSKRGTDVEKTVKSVDGLITIVKHE